MSEDVNIRFRTTTEGTGIEDTREELDRLTRQVSDAEREMGALVDETNDLNAELGDLEDNAEANGDQFTALRRVAIGAAFTAAAAGVAELGRGLQTTGDDLAEFDSAAGDTVRSLGEVAEEAGNAAALIIGGFAAGGPVGAALGTVAAGFQAIQGDIADAAALSRRVAASISTDWELSAESVAEVTAETDRYRRSITELNAAREEEARVIATTFDQERQLRDLRLEIAERNAAVQISDIENSDLPQEEKDRQINVINDRLTANRQFNERADNSAEIQQAEQELAALREANIQAQNELADALREAAANPASDAEQAKSDVESRLEAIRGEANSIAGVLRANTGFVGLLRQATFTQDTGFASRGAINGIVENLDQATSNQDLDEQVRLITEAGELINSSRLNDAGGDNTLANRAGAVAEQRELLEQERALAEAATAAANEAAANLEAAQQQAEAAQQALESRDNALVSTITVARERQRLLPNVQQSEARSEAENRRAEQEASRAAAAQRQAAENERARREQERADNERREQEQAANDTFDSAARGGGDISRQLGLNDRIQSAFNNIENAGRDGFSTQEREQVINLITGLINRVESLAQRDGTSQAEANALRRLDDLQRQVNNIESVQSRTRR